VSVRQDAAAVGAATAATGSAVTAAVAAACCVGPSIAPLLLPVLGASGLIAIAALRPYMIWLEIITALLLAFSFWQVYRRRVACGNSNGSPTPTSHGVARIVTWVATGLWLVSLLYALYGVTHE
jgi:mercuric ion transport protein